MAADSNLPYPDNQPPQLVEEPKSLWKRYSLGIAANNKVVDSKLLYVTPIEVIQLQNGELISNPFHQESEGWDAKDELYKTKVITDTAVEAIWKGETNRRTAPDVRRGERVWLWRYADRDEYYWESAGLDDHLRKLETVVYGISGTPDEPKDGTQPDHGYYAEMSTHKGSITVTTSCKNGEFTTYAIQIDAKNGRVTISDAIGNRIHLNSKDTLIELYNADKTFIQLDKQNIHINAPDSIDAHAGSNVDIQAGNAIRLEAGGNIVLKADGKLLVDATSEFQKEVTMVQKLTANGIQSGAPIVGPTDTI